VDTSAAPIREATGRVVGFVLVFRDMTDRRRVEEELRASETRFRQLADAMPQIVWVTRPDGYHEYYNRRWYDYIGCTPEECLGYGWSDPLHPDDRERSQRRWQESLRTGEPYEVEYRFRSRDGEYRWFLGRALPVRDEAGGIVKWFGTCTDIHDRKLQAEEKARLLDALREADRRKNEFLATLAHELRNPLAAVRNGLHLLRVSPPGADLTDVREMLERQVAHMTRLIEDLLDLGRINNGKIRLITGAVDLAAVAARATDLARPLAEAHRQSIDLDRPPSPVWVNGDEVRLAQIVNNLLTNASKYTPEGGHLHVAVCAEAEEAILRVHDDGVGIEPAMLEKVFEMFSQERDSESRAQGGLGIGLTLVRALAALHGGTVSAASPGRGQGSTFTVRLPLSREVPTSAPLPTVETGSAGPAARRVLIADDNADAAGTLACLLGAFGHDARVAHDGPAALATAAEFRPDVVLLDIGMPGLSGLEVARRLRGMPAGRGATLVAVTGYGHDDDRRRSREAGCDAHLVKPVDPEAILRLLEASPGRRGEA
jgi:PAS domain S-box-containing protein